MKTAYLILLLGCGFLAACVNPASLASEPAAATTSADLPATNPAHETTPALTPTPQPPAATRMLLPTERPPAGAEREFSTDFSRHTVPYSEILSGGPSKDGIPAIDEPLFVSVAEADAWLQPNEPVVFV